MDLRRTFTPTTIALVAVFAGLIAASTIWPGIQIAAGVPITLQTFAVLLAGAVLGPWRGASAVVVYLILGTAGLPVFASHMAGPGVWAKPTAGFLVSFMFAAFVTGWIVRALRRAHKLNLWGVLAATATGSLVVINLIGYTWLLVYLGSPVRDIAAMALPFLPGDVIKLVLAAVVAWAIHRAYPGLLAESPRVRTEDAGEGDDEPATASAEEQAPAPTA